MFFAELADVVAGARLADVDQPQLEHPVADLARAELAAAQVALVLVVDPQDLVLPVGLVERVEVVEEVDRPGRGRGGRGRSGDPGVLAAAGTEQREQQEGRQQGNRSHGTGLIDWNQRRMMP